MNTSKELNDNFKLIKAAIDGFKGICRKAEDDYVALGKKTAGLLIEQAQTHLKSLFKAIDDDQERVLKNIAAAEERVLAAIEDLHKQSLAMLEAKTNFEIENIRAVGDTEEKFLRGFAQEVGFALNLKEREGKND